VEEGLIAAVFDQTKCSRSCSHPRQVLVPFVLFLLLDVVSVSSLHSLMASPLHRTPVVPLSARPLNLSCQPLQRCFPLKLTASRSPKEAFVWLIPGHCIIGQLFKWCETGLGRSIDTESTVHGGLLGAWSDQTSPRYRVHRWGSLQGWSRRVPARVSVFLVVSTVSWQLRLEKIRVESELEGSRGWGWTRSRWVGRKEIVARQSHKLVTKICLKAVGRGRGDEVRRLQVGEWRCWMHRRCGCHSCFGQEKV